jgi:hypothetical protein
VAEQRRTMCGRPLDAHDRQVRFRLPEPVLTSPAQEKTPGSWLSHDSPETSVMMQVPAIGAFIRALLPVRLSGGHTITFGVWMCINPRELPRVFAVWWEPEYRHLRLDGALANSIPPWDCWPLP